MIRPGRAPVRDLSEGKAPMALTITFLGAGSVVFTRELLADIIGFGDLGELDISLQDIDKERLETATAIAHRTVDQLDAGG